MDITDARRYGFHVAGVDAHRLACRQQRTVLATDKALRVFGATQHANQAPHPVVVDRRLLAWPPYETDDGKALARIAMQQVLLVTGRVRLRQRLGQPVVMGDQAAQQALAVVEEGGFVGFPVQQLRKCVDEVAQALEAQGLAHGSGSADGLIKP
ncbi:hypothetical protein D3C85_1105460 [compost metagenome]